MIGIEPRAEYTNRVREAVIDRLLDDGMSFNRLQQSMRSDCLLDLSAAFLSGCLDWKVRQSDLPAYRPWTLAYFSGTIRVDELHLGIASCSWPPTRTATSPSPSPRSWPTTKTSCDAS